MDNFWSFYIIIIVAINIIGSAILLQWTRYYRPKNIEEGEKLDHNIDRLFYLFEIRLIQFHHIEIVETIHLVRILRALVHSKRTLQLSEDILRLNQIVADRFVARFELLDLKP